MQCNISFDAPQYRYILSATIVDHTGSEWITLFNDQAVMILDNRTATDLAKLKDAGEAGSAEWNAVFQRANFKQYNMRLKAKVRMLCMHACVSRARVSWVVHSCLIFCVHHCYFR